MSTKYFILTKSQTSSIEDNTDNQIMCLNKGQTFILPQINLNYYNDKGLFENQLLEWSKQLCSPDKIFLDIGAHTGTYSITLAPYSKEVYSFEPQKMTYYALCGSIALSNLTNVTCIQTGLGSVEQVGNTILNIVSNDGGGSTIHTNDSQRILREETISIQTLDYYQIDNVGLIKMDVEENELYVLKGATETLKRSNYPKILFESNYNNENLFEYLKTELGYKIIPLRGWNNMFLAEQ